MTIMKWKPVRNPLVEWRHPLNAWAPVSRLMEEFFASDQDNNNMYWRPNVDIIENEDSYEIQAELPGMKKEDVQLSIENNVLTISGETSQEVKEDRRNYLRVERSYGRFERSFSLSNNVDRDNVRAEFEDGVLKVSLPKAEEAKARTIKIDVK